jgi:hypothetical protein
MGVYVLPDIGKLAMLQFHMLKICLFFTAMLFPIIGISEVTTVNEHLEAAATQPIANPASDKWRLRPMSDAEFTSAMCVLGATVGMAMTYMAGPNEVIMLVVGGVVVPSSPTILFWSLFGTMAAAGCTIGASSTAAISRLYQ